MTQAESLADALQGLFSDPQAGWFTPILIAIQGLTPAQAAHIPQQRFNSVWRVVNHVRFWQEYMLLRLQREKMYRDALGGKDGWPSIPENHTQEAWEADRERMLLANHNLAEYTRALSDAALHQSVAPGNPSPYQVLQGLIAHNSHHTCEVISIRHMLGVWLERT